MGQWAQGPGPGPGPGPDFWICSGAPGGPYLASPRNLPLGELIGTSFGAVRGPIRPFLKIGPTCVRRVKPLGIEPGLGRQEQGLGRREMAHSFLRRKNRRGKNMDSNHVGFARQQSSESCKSFEILESPDHKTLGFGTRWPPAFFSPEKQQPPKIVGPTFNSKANANFHANLFPTTVSCKQLASRKAKQVLDLPPT